MKIEIRCPRCGESDIVAESAIGKRAQCNRCLSFFGVEGSQTERGDSLKEPAAPRSKLPTTQSNTTGREIPVVTQAGVAGFCATLRDLEVPVGAKVFFILVMILLCIPILILGIPILVLCFGYWLVSFPFSPFIRDRYDSPYRFREKMILAQKVKGRVAIALLAAVILIPVASLLYLGGKGLFNLSVEVRHQADRDRERAEQKEIAEKADMMRRKGFEGTDAELARMADEIKRFNKSVEAERERQEEQTKKYLDP